jgi:hypothetical protein
MFGRGKIDISVQKTRYAPGDTISGSVALTLNKPAKAREMTISLIGEYKTTVTSRGVGRRGVLPVHPGARGFGRVDRRMLMSEAVRKSAPQYDLRESEKTANIYGFREQLDGETEYSQSRRYHFEIKITGDMPTSSNVSWYLLSKLDIPHGRDITKKVRITIG